MLQPSENELDQLDELIRSVASIGLQLDDDEMEPNPAADWGGLRHRITNLQRRWENEVVARAEASLPLLGPADRARVSDDAALVGAEIASLLTLDGAESAALGVLRAAGQLAAPGREVASELSAALKAPREHVALTRARYHHRKSQFERGDAVLRDALKSSRDETLRAAMNALLNSLRPIASAPALFRFNGCGVGLYGERDVRDDGTCVSTTCICLVFVPIFPLSAYRVTDHRNGSYTFYGKVPLSPFARGARAVIGAALVLAIAWGAVTSWLNSPSRLASIALDEAAALQASGHPAEALTAYEAALASYQSTLDDAAEARAGQEVASLLFIGVEPPLEVARSQEVERLVTRFESLPPAARRGAAGQSVAAHVIGLAQSLGATREAHLAALQLASAAERVGTSDLPELGVLRRERHRALAQDAAAQWPAEAVAHWAAAGDALSVAAALETLSSLAQEPSLMVELQGDVGRLAVAVGGGSTHAEAITRAQDAVATGLGFASREGRAAALMSEDVGSLTASLEAEPRDQEVRAALAATLRAGGDSAGARVLVDAIGAPGRMARGARRVHAMLLADEGDASGAVEVLGRDVARGLPAFSEAARSFESVSQTVYAQLEAMLRGPRPPVELERQLRDVTDDERGRAIVEAWFAERAAQSVELRAAREAYEREAELVPVVLTLAQLELQLANAAADDERERWLGEAERHFLAIRSEAQGVPSFHIGLGQVYHRMGRAQDAEAEMQTALAGADAPTQLEVARVYRDLGQLARARETAQAVYDAGEPEMAGAAAVILFLSSEREDERERWLRLAPADQPFVRISLLELTATRALRGGRYAEADRAFARASSEHLELGESGASYNNAALANYMRFRCTGDQAHLARATELMERAARLSPQSGIAIGNVADMQHDAAVVAVLEGHVRVRALRHGIDDVVTLLRDTPLADEFRTQLAAQRQERRARELTAQEQTLAPQALRGWLRERAWLDEPGLANLRDRLRRVTGLQTQSDAYDAWVSGEDDATFRTRLDESVQTAEAAIAEADGTRHGPTRAAAHFIAAMALRTRAMISEHRADDLRASESHMRECQRLWPEAAPGVSRALVVLLLELAEAETSAQSPALARDFTAFARTLGPATRLYQTHQREGGGAFTSLRAHAAAARARAELSLMAPDRLGPHDYMIAVVLDDAALMAAAEPSLSAPRSRVEHELDTLLRPQSAETEIMGALLRP